jgi:AcrR family transcriptional regulator
MAKRRSHDEEDKMAWVGAAIIDGAEAARRRDALTTGPRERAAASRLVLGRTALEMAGELGYQQVTVEELIDRAGSNRARFYDVFVDKEACFTWAYEAGADALCECLLSACAEGPDWASGIRRALVALAALVGAERGVAAGLLTEHREAGTAVTAKRQEVVGRLTRAIDRARRETTDSRHAPPPFTAQFILSAVEAAVLKFLVDPGEGGFEAEVPDLLYLAVEIYLGPEAARAQVRALRLGD